MNVSFLQDIKDYCQNRPVRLIAVSKGQPVSAIEEALKTGINHIGENYLQEAQEKMALLQHQPIQWHFIGAIQSNKIKAIAHCFDWVDTLSTPEQALKFNQQRPASMHDLNVLIQVKLDNEIQKSGCSPETLVSLAKTILDCPRLRLRGLFAMPQPQPTKEAQYQSFLRYKVLFDDLMALSQTVDTLSMGMSGDWQAAIDAGSTALRIGQALFGPRQGKPR